MNPTYLLKVISGVALERMSLALICEPSARTTPLASPWLLVVIWWTWNNLTVANTYIFQNIFWRIFYNKKVFFWRNTSKLTTRVLLIKRLIWKNMKFFFFFLYIMNKMSHFWLFLTWYKILHAADKWSIIMFSNKK